MTWKARLRGYQAYYYEEKWGRSGNYRNIYLENNKKSEYTCVYCGKLIPKDSITVDHVIPVDAAKKSRILQLYMTARGFDGINDERNLIHACWDCNSAKGRNNSMIWAIRAHLGKHKVYWIFRRTVFFALAALILIWLLTYIAAGLPVVNPISP